MAKKRGVARYELSNEQWEKIKDFLPGKLVTVAEQPLIIDCSLMQYYGF